MRREDRLRRRRQAHRLAHRLIRFLREEFQWDIRFMPLGSDLRARRSIGFERPIVGATLWDRYLICIDPAYKDLLAVLIHECLHAVFPDASEAKVLRLESLVRSHLTPRQGRAFVLLMARRLK